MDRPDVNDTLPRLSTLEAPYRPLPRLLRLSLLRGPHEEGAPPPDDAENWTKLMNLLFLYEQDQLFVWARGVRHAVEEEASA